MYCQIIPDIYMEETATANRYHHDELPDATQLQPLASQWKIYGDESSRMFRTLTPISINTNFIRRMSLSRCALAVQMCIYEKNGANTKVMPLLIQLCFQKVHLFMSANVFNEHILPAR